MAMERGRLGSNLPAGEQVEPLLDAQDKFVFEVDSGDPLDDGTPVEGDEAYSPSLPELPPDHAANLAEELSEDALDALARYLTPLIEADASSRQDWAEIFKDGLDLLGFQIEAVSEPFEGACSAVHPILAESIIKYQAKARAQLLPPGGPVKTQIMGKKTPEKEAQAKRVRDWLNFQIEVEMTEYEPEHDRMLFNQAFFGSAFTKTYYDPRLGRPVSRMVKPQNFLCAYTTTDLESAVRYTEVLPMTEYDLKTLKRAGVYRDDVECEPTTEGPDELTSKSDEFHGLSPAFGEDTYLLYEVHTYLDLDRFRLGDDGDDYDDSGELLPYVVTLDAGSGHVLAVRRNWDENDPHRKKITWYTHWPFIPGFGFYGYGYVHIVGGLAKSATTSLRQLVDAGTFANLQGGFKAHGLRVVGSSEPISPGEWREVNAPGIDIQKALVPLPYKEPSGTLFNLLEFLVATAQKFADSTEQVVSESTNYGPVGTTLALLEAGGRLFNAIHERIFKAHAKELRLLAQINAQTLPAEYPYEVAGGTQIIMRDDFRGVDILPVSDPRSPSEAHRIARLQAQMTLAQQFPQHHNLKALLKELHILLGREDPNEVLAPDPPQARPLDPVSDILAASQGLPIQAFPGQDHDSHVKVKALWVQQNLKNELLQQAVAAVTANLREHHMLKYQEAMMALIGQRTGLPPEQMAQALQSGQIDPNTLAALQAELAETVARYAAGTALEQAFTDPLVQLQLKEIEVKAANEANNRRKIDLDNAFKHTELQVQAELKEKELSLKAREAGGKMALDGAKVQVQAKQAKEQAKVARDKTATDRLKAQKPPTKT